MEMQYKSASSDHERATQGFENEGSNVKAVANQRNALRSDFLLRLLALALTLVAALVLGVSKETEIVALSIVPGLPPLNVPVTAKWQYLSAFLYFVVSNSIACAYAAFSLVLSVANRRGKNGSVLALIVMDLLMVALLFSGNGAAAAIGVIGYKGNSHVNWKKVCDVFGNFCNHVAASVAISLLASLNFLFLVLLCALRLHKNSR